MKVVCECGFVRYMHTHVMCFYDHRPLSVHVHKGRFPEQLSMLFM